jgi:hypothetical protein
MAIAEVLDFATLYFSALDFSIPKVKIVAYRLIDMVKSHLQLNSNTILVFVIPVILFFKRIIFFNKNSNCNWMFVFFSFLIQLPCFYN